MTNVTIKETQNPTILKFEFEDFITQNESFEFKNIDEAKSSPLAQQLFYLPFVKTIYIRKLHRYRKNITLLNGMMLKMP
jgi:hypothetical protein